MRTRAALPAIHKTLDVKVFVVYNYCIVQRRSDPPNKSPIEEFRRSLRVLEREIVRQLAQETGCCGVTLAQCHALLELSQAELSLNALAGAVDLDASTLSRTVDGMVKCGFVERTEDSTDRRSVRLRLTATGRHKVAVIDEMCNRYYAHLLGQMVDRDQRCVIRAVGLLADLMRQQRFRGPEGCCATSDKKAPAGSRTGRKLKPDE